MASSMLRSARIVTNTLSLQTVRCLNTSSVRADLIRAPIQVFGLHGRYAHAIYSAASKHKCLEKVEGDLVAMKELIDSDILLERLIANPFMKRQVKKGVLAELLKKRNAHALTLQFFDVLTGNNRLGAASDIVVAFSRIMGAHRGEVECTITTANKLNPEQEKSVKSSLQGFIEKNQKINLTTKVEPTILGGMIVDIGDKYIDMSIASRIKKISQALATTI